jgi:hypothetical protein
LVRFTYRPPFSKKVGLKHQAYENTKPPDHARRPVTLYRLTELCLALARKPDGTVDLDDMDSVLPAAIEFLIHANDWLYAAQSDAAEPEKARKREYSADPDNPENSREKAQSKRCIRQMPAQIRAFPTYR